MRHDRKEIIVLLCLGALIVVSLLVGDCSGVSW